MKNLDIKKRFHSKYRVQPDSGCWNWIGGVDKVGYGRIWDMRVKGNSNYAHRVSYELHYADPGDMLVCHKCDNRKCVNPEHFFLGTRKDNMDDKVEKNRQSMGEYSGRNKLTDAQVISIYSLCDTELTQKEIGIMFKIDASCVSDIKNHKSWKHVTGKVQS